MILGAIRFRTAVLCAAILLAACSAQQQNQAQKSVNSATLAGAVHAKLATIDADSLTSVKVETSDGVVTLSGQARSARERADYASAAAGVNGVTRVENRLGIDPQLRGPREGVADAALAAKVTANIAAQAGINAVKIQPSAHDGVVTLTGTVSSEALKNTILDTARKTAGVKNVVDRIEVKS